MIGKQAVSNPVPFSSGCIASTVMRRPSASTANRACRPPQSRAPYLRLVPTYNTDSPGIVAHDHEAIPRSGDGAAHGLGG